MPVFRKAGIYPLYKEKVLNRYFKEKRRQNKRKKKLSTPTGKSIFFEDLLQREIGPSTGNVRKSQVKTKKMNIPKTMSSSSEDSDKPLHEFSGDLSFSDSEDMQNFETHDHLLEMTLEGNKAWEKMILSVSYDKQYYAGLIHKMPEEGEEGPTVDCMERISKFGPKRRSSSFTAGKTLLAKISHQNC